MIISATNADVSADTDLATVPFIPEPVDRVSIS
jgi:hypothetical protein